MNDAFQALERAHLPLRLSPISIRELLFINDAPCEIYGLENELFKKILHRRDFINKNVLREMINQGQVHLFVKNEDRQELIKYIQTALTQVTRSLSIGNPLEKGKKQMNLLTISMGYLYQNPTSDQLLKIQHQSAKNLAYFLMPRPDIHEGLYSEFIKQKHHFIYAQPLLSSLFTLGILKHSQKYSDQEIENLFIASYFKDLGMSAIPAEKYDADDLDQDEKNLLRGHAHSSVKMLKGRLPIPPNHFTIIEHHHNFSLLQREMDDDILAPLDQIKSSENNVQETADVLIGFETIIISSMDIISAMIAGRPYRESTKLFESLDLIKELIADQYPQEFRLIVSYFKSFFFNRL